MHWAIAAAESGLVPDIVIRAGIRRLLAARLRAERPAPGETALARRLARYDQWRRGPLAIETEAANRQHYELPAAFFEQILGPHLKYSACAWPAGVDDLAAAEEHTLELTLSRARMADGLTLLDLGCGWGSLSLYAARRYPRSRVLAVSNSASQGEFVRARAAARGLANLEVRTADVRSFAPAERFDRVVSVEMFEHLRNWQLAFQRVASWLEPGGLMLLHVFCHADVAYAYEDAGDGDWMARHFFTGGIMPAADQPYHHQQDLVVRHHWRLDGRDYQRTLDAWLARMDRAREPLAPVFQEVYGGDWRRWWRRWRLFFLACSELFGCRGGREWWVSHYLLAPRADQAAAPVPPAAGEVVPFAAGGGR